MSKKTDDLRIARRRYIECANTAVAAINAMRDILPKLQNGAYRELEVHGASEENQDFRMVLAKASDLLHHAENDVTTASALMVAAFYLHEQLDTSSAKDIP